MKKQTGFTLIELMIVVAIVAILAAIALPAYSKYTARSKFAEVVTATNGLKQQVELCIYDLGTKTGCTSEKSGAGWSIKASDQYATKYIATIAVANGTITATAKDVEGLGGKTFVLTPTVEAGGQVTWTNTAGDCRAAELC